MHQVTHLEQDGHLVLNVHCVKPQALNSITIHLLARQPSMIDDLNLIPEDAGYVDHEDYVPEPVGQLVAADDSSL
ncbi:MAG: hypothetical protein ABFC56_06665 [Clostridiaceae bacterium]